jgi:hypothetical protein
MKGANIMAGPTQINHRRDRREIRRVLAEIVVRGRDLTGSFFLADFDLMDRFNRLPANDNCEDFAVVTQGAPDACR